jgi:hypothetical protein
MEEKGRRNITFEAMSWKRNRFKRLFFNFHAFYADSIDEELHVLRRLYALPQQGKGRRAGRTSSEKGNGVSGMSTIGWTSSIHASSLVDKLQHTQQAQEEIGQVQASARAREEDHRRQTTVTDTAEDEKVRMQRKKEEEERQRKKRKMHSKAESKEEEPEVKIRKRRLKGNVDILV